MTQESSSQTPERKAPGWRAYSRYDLEVVADRDDKASEIKLGSVRRPHMRAFHYAWFGFFSAFFIWFAITPLLPYMETELNLSKKELWNSYISGLISTTVVRIIMGPICDVYGPRIPFAAMLCMASIPAAMIGLVRGAAGLYALRFFLGIAGGTFVTCEYWASRMFIKEIVGTANGLVGGWGNLGSGMSVLIMQSILLPLFKAMTRDDSVAWRTVSVVPAAVAFTVGVLILYCTDDAPRGNYCDMKKADLDLAKRRSLTSFRQAALDGNTWILFAQYACCFGVEITMKDAAASYFYDTFGQSREVSVAVASIFGWLDFFARAMGGLMSDLSHSRAGVRGRLWVHTFALLLEGALILMFAHCRTLGGSIVALIFFSLFVKIAEGSTYGIVPYVQPRNMGSVIGITGAGGSVGALAFGLLFRELPDHQKGLIWMGGIVFASSLFSFAISIRGHRSLLFGVDRNVDPETGSIRSNGNSRSESDLGS